MTGSATEFFGADYLEYWKRRVTDASDGSMVAGDAALDCYMRLLSIEPEHRVLDLGCGFGRIFPLIAAYSPQV